MRAWVCVSDEFDVVRITKSIIESAIENSCGLKELSHLHDKLKKALVGKKFLLVLDDVWNENYDAWMALITPFRAGAKGSKIIVTTRSHEVSSITGTESFRRLELLSDEDCFSLFKQHAFTNQNYSGDACSNLEKIGKEIVKKCKGLPLAAKALGGLLRSKQEEDEWEDVLNSEIWNLFDDRKGELLPALRLSYSHLPAHLKPCFLYCAIFPKDYRFNKEELVLLWMAQGFVQPEENNKKRMEDIGEEYFRELMQRSFFQQSNKCKTQFLMHDLINDLAQVVSGETCFMMEVGKQPKKLLSKKSRHFSHWIHFSYQYEEYDVSKKLEEFSEATNLRTFLFCSRVPTQIPKGLPLKLTCLRVLWLKGSNIVGLPESIHNLVHLRYLNLSSTSIRRLPESVNSLYHLQTLLLNHCHDLEELPSDMGNLIYLRHLEIRGCFKLGKMSRGIGRLTELQTLTTFIVGKNNGLGIEELKDLKHLQGKLEVSGLENVRDPISMEINLRNKKHLCTLYFKWDDSSLINDSQVKSSVVLDMLQPHTNLKELTVKGYSGTRFPSWLESPSYYSNLVTLHLFGCKNCKSLPPLGQLPSLEDLEISKMQGVQKVGPEFYGNGSNNKPFQSLKRLVFSQMQKWEEWTGIGQEGEEFPCLEKLGVICCPKLRTFSHCFPKLVKLKIHFCYKLTALSRLPSLGNLEKKEEYPRLRELAIACCPKLRELPRLTSSSLERLVIAGPTKLNELPKRQLTSLDELILFDCDNELLKYVVPFTPPTILNISGISSLICLLPHEESFLRCLETLQTRDISFCQELTFLWPRKQVVGAGLQHYHHHFTSLRRLTIYSCQELVSLSSSDSCGEWGMMFPRLEYLNISFCDKLKQISNGLHKLSFLRELIIQHCIGIESLFPEEEMALPFMLRRISIIDCINLKSLPEVLLMPNNSNTSLECLDIIGCSSLSSFSRSSNSSRCSSLLKGINTTKLKEIEICSCDNLVSLPVGLHNLTSLKELEISECPSLLSFPEGGLSSANLRRFEINDCKNLKSLPDQMNLLTSLEELKISECPSILSFPEGGLPSTNLKFLGIWDCNDLKFLSDQMHNNITSLRRLHIRNCSSLITSFLEVGFFPSNLHSLTIGNYYNSTDLLPLLSQWEMQFYRLKSLTTLSLSGYKGLESFLEWPLPSTLTHLVIDNFPHLKSLSSKGLQHLTSLRYLSITNCPKLASLPKEELLTMLFELKIYDCPLLKQWYEKLKREDSPILPRAPIIAVMESQKFERARIDLPPNPFRISVSI